MKRWPAPQLPVREGFAALRPAAGGLARKPKLAPVPEPDGASLTDVVVRRPRVRGDVPDLAVGEDISEYWNGLRRGRIFPSRGDLNAKEICFYWPNTMVIAVDPTEGRLHIQKMFFAQGSLHGLASHTGGDTSIVTEWALQVVRAAIQEAQAYREQAEFPTTEGAARYEAIVLPLSDDGEQVDSVLCNLQRLES